MVPLNHRTHLSPWTEQAVPQIQCWHHHGTKRRPLEEIPVIFTKASPTNHKQIKPTLLSMDYIIRVTSDIIRLHPKNHHGAVHLFLFRPVFFTCSAISVLLLSVFCRKLHCSPCCPLRWNYITSVSYVAIMLSQSKKTQCKRRVAWFPFQTKDK